MITTALHHACTPRASPQDMCSDAARFWSTALCCQRRVVTGRLVQVTFLVSQVWHGVSAVQRRRGDSGADKGLHRRTAGLRLARWRRERPCVPGNLVLLKDEEAVELCEKGREEWCAQRPGLHEFVDGVLQQVGAFFGSA